MPLKYRNKEEYVIPKEIENYGPRLKILRPQTDFGPITKLLPAIEEAKKKDPNAIVVTVDDDSGYSADLIAQLVKHSIISGAVVGSSGVDVGFWGINGGIDWPQKLNSLPACRSGYDLAYCDMVEGFGAIAYRANLVDVELMRMLSQVDTACRLSDDLVINFVLALQNIPRILFSGRPSSSVVVQFSSGFDAGALHLGSGFDGQGSGAT